MYALREAGPRVPDDVALVAFVDFGRAELFSPRLTTLARPLHAIGAKRGSAAAQAARDPSVPPRTTRLPPQLRHRHSCGCRS
jgi:LacI family transcriptional regulator